MDYGKKMSGKKMSGKKMSSAKACAKCKKMGKKSCSCKK